MFFLSGCNDFKVWFIREFRQDTLADGVSRLLIQDISIIAKEVSAKFDEPSAELVIKKNNQITEQEKHGRGDFVKAIYNVVIDYPNEKIVHKDCRGDYATWQGKVEIISATMAAKGYSTNNVTRPVVPDPDSIRMQIHAKAENLAIIFPGKGGYLFLNEAEFKYTAIPRLATTQKGFTAGMRTTPTADLRLEDIKVINAKGTLYSDRVVMPIVVEQGNLFSQVGRHDDGLENVLSGTLTMFGQTRAIVSDNRGLDPDYDAEAFKESYSCHEDLQKRVSFNHLPFEAKLANPTAGLSSLIMGEITYVLEHNERCGMSSPQVLKNTHFTEAAGENGDVEYHVISPCPITFANYETQEDCFGRKYIFNGSIRVKKASKKIRGLIVTDPEQYQKALLLYEESLKKAKNEAELKKIIEKKPMTVIPTSMQSVEVLVDVEFNNLRVKSSCSALGNNAHGHHCQNRKNDPAVNVSFLSGGALATFKPILAKEMDPKKLGAGFCSAQVPVNEGEISLFDLKAEIKSEGNRLPILANGSFAMVSGKIGSRENQLTGYLQIGGRKISFSDGRNLTHSPLIEDFDPEIFAASYTCAPVLLPRSDHDCVPHYGLALNFGRLLVMNAASLMQISSSEDIPGSFASKQAVSNRIIDQNGSRLTLSAEVLGPIDLKENKYQAVRFVKDGLGNELVISGLIPELRGVAITEGVRINSPTLIAGRNVNPLTNRWIEALMAKVFSRKEAFIRPTKPEAMKLHIEAKVEDFACKFIEANQIGPKDPYLWFDSGRFSMDATPFLGLDERSVGDVHPSYSIPTPIVRFDHLEVSHVKAILRGEQGFALPIYIVKAELQAFSGKYKGEGNYIQGKLSFLPLSDFSNMNEAQHPIEVILNKEPLKPGFDQNLFNESYIDTPHLKAVLPHYQ